MIGLYIFDMGEVISRNTDVSRSIAEHFGVPLEEWRGRFREQFVALMAGSITTEEFWRSCSAVIGQRVQEDLWALYFHPEQDPEMIKLIRELKGEARVVVGTNTIEPHYLKHEANGDYSIFDRVYASHRIGLVKPDPSFYIHILEHEGFTPQQTVFVDDTQVNVVAARRLGIHALLFTGAETLRRDLSTLRNEVFRSDSG